MKRILFFVCFAVAALNSSAYSGDVSMSSSSGLIVILSIVFFLWGILEIILFFKMWGMTNDVKALKKEFFKETKYETKSDMAKQLRKDLMLGNIEKVKQTLLQNFMENVEQGFAELKACEIGKDEKGKEIWVSTKEKNYKESIRPFIDSLQKQYNKIGEELPLYIQRMQCYGDYYKLFLPEDLATKTEQKPVQADL